ncbi:uncharacterized protein TNCV_3008161 [Trichonephila clavipes]|nr:uncharacterized protein TNCV_3008161 [Trichonephila clavipes]
MMKLRLYTCKIVLATSLVWFICGVVLMMYYTDCIGDNSAACQSFRSQKARGISIRAQKLFMLTEPSTTSADENFRYWSPVGE